MNREIPGHCAGYTPIDPAAARREVERSPWPTQAGTRRELVCRAARLDMERDMARWEGRRTLARVRTAAGVLLTVIYLGGILSFCVVGAVALARSW